MVRGGKWLIGVGVGLLVIALLWLVFAVPALVRYPLDIDATPVYEGTFTLFVDPDTFAPLDTPRELPLKVTRHIDALGSKSSYSKVVVSEKIELDAGGEFAQSQDNQYVMDRRSIENVASDNAYAFTPGNVVDRSPAYRINFPLDTDPDGEYLIYKNEVGTTYTATPDPVEPELEVDGLHLIAFAASAGPLPITQAYIDLLSESVPLPESLTITQLTPLLLSVGIDVPGTLAAPRPGHLARGPGGAHEPRDQARRAGLPRHVQWQRCGRARDRSDRRREGPRRDDLRDRVRGRVASDHRRAAALPAGARGTGRAHGIDLVEDEPDPTVPQRVLTDRRVDRRTSRAR